jgi:hypothetical protein
MMNVSISCETTVDPTARTPSQRPRVRARSSAKTPASSSWLVANATTDPMMIHIDCPNTSANAASLTGEIGDALTCMQMSSNANE